MRKAAAILFLLALPGCATFDSLFGPDDPADSGALGETDITAGLKEALATGASRAITRIGRKDGLWKNDALRIPLPSNLEKAAKLMRTFGRDEIVDEFHLSLNRAAERAIPEAETVFRDAIFGMTLSDAQRILDGPPDAATRHFRGKTETALAARLKPIVANATSAAGATRNFKAFVNKASRAVSTREMQKLDLDAYVTERALEALFRTLAEEEKRIREDPAARSSELLRRVFAGD